MEEKETKLTNTNINAGLIVSAEIVRNFIFILLCFLAAQPILYIIISQLMYGKIKYYLSSVDSTYTPYFTIWLSPIIKVVSLTLIILFVVYLICVKFTKNVQIKSLKNPLIGSLKSKLELYFFALTFIWITIAFLVDGNYARTFNDIPWSKRGYIYFMCYAAIAVSYFATTKKQKKIILETLIASMTFVALLAVMIDGFGWFKMHCYVLKGAAIFQNRNYYGYFVAIGTVLPAARLYKEKKLALQIYYGFCFAFNEIALLLTLTRGAFLGACAGIIILLIFIPIQEKKFNLKLLLIPAIAIVVYAISELSGISQFTTRVLLLSSDASKAANADQYTQEELDAMGSGRIKIWRSMIEHIKSSPIFGVGIGNTENPHNEFLQVAAWSGIPACIFYVAGIVTLVVNTFRYKSELTDTQLAALVGAGAYIVSSFFGNGLLQAIPFFILVLGLSFNIDIKIQDNEGEVRELQNVQTPEVNEVPPISETQTV